MAEHELNIGILLSGSGSTAERVVKETRNGGILDGAVRVAFAVTNRDRHKAAGADKMEGLGIPVRILRKGHEYNTSTQLAFGILDFALQQEFKQGNKIDGLAQLGWIPMTPQQVVNFFSSEDRFIFNQHCGPLDPAHRDSQGRRLDYGGKGMMGRAVTAATLAYAWHTGENLFTESTVHTVSPDTSDYDGGEALSVVRFQHPLYEIGINSDEFEANTVLLERATHVVHQELIGVEHDNVVDTLLKMSQNKQSVAATGRELIPQRNADILYRFRALATKIFPQG